MKTQNWGMPIASALYIEPGTAWRIPPSLHCGVRRYPCRKDYLLKRENGDEPEWFKTKFPEYTDIPDSAYSWVAPDGRKFPVKRDSQDADYFFCPKEVQYRKDDGYWYADLRLDETPQMRECMEQRDVEYILLLKSQGKLLATEPQADKEILQAEQGEWKHPHQFHDEIFATMAAARKEVEIFGKELSEVERKAKQEEEEAKRLQSNR